MLGDVMLDEWIYGPLRPRSDEAPTPLLTWQDRAVTPGGAAHLAAVLARNGLQVQLVGVVGADREGAALAGLLEARTVDLHLLELPDRPTTLKLRYIGEGRQVLRVDRETTDAVPPTWLAARVGTLVNDADVLLVSDYGKGVVTADLLDILRLLRPQHCVCDPKQPLGLFAGLGTLAPDEAAFRRWTGQASGASYTELARVAERARAALALHGLVVTLGPRGAVSADVTQSRAHPVTPLCGACVVGAGDVVTAVLAVAQVEELPMDQAVDWAMAVATAAVAPRDDPRPLLPEFGTPAGWSPDLKVVEERRAAALAAAARSQGRVTVLINGCFDLLHPGHVEFLTWAAGLGDFVVVAVNMDQGVRRLKGPGRPVEPLAVRARRLARLPFVDVVVPFSADDAGAVIASLQPCVYAKGGDYAERRLAEASSLRAHGVDVRIGPWFQGYSTTRILERSGRLG